MLNKNLRFYQATMKNIILTDILSEGQFLSHQSNLFQSFFKCYVFGTEFAKHRPLNKKKQLTIKLSRI